MVIVNNGNCNCKQHTMENDRQRWMTYYGKW